jgi:hypothetical protein
MEYSNKINSYAIDTNLYLFCEPKTLKHKAKLGEKNPFIISTKYKIIRWNL